MYSYETFLEVFVYSLIATNVLSLWYISRLEKRIFQLTKPLDKDKFKLVLVKKD